MMFAPAFRRRDKADIIPPMTTEQAILDCIREQRGALLAGGRSGLAVPPFAGHTGLESPNGSTVIALELAPATCAALPPSHRHLDLFLLAPNSRLGSHYHVHASARIHIIAGCGEAVVDGVRTAFVPGDRLRFPCGSRHDVASGDEPVLFASFQDNPIVQPDGTLDYHVD